MMKNKIFLGICCLILIIFCGYYYFFYYRPVQQINGYWCHYQATGSLVVSLKTDYTAAEKQSIEAYLKTIKGLKSYDFIVKEKLTTEGQAFDTFFVYYNQSNGLNEVVNIIKQMAGVKAVVANNLKSDLEMYYLDHNQYEYYQVITTKPIIKGSYQYLNHTISFDRKQKLYYKDSQMCRDEACTIIFTKTNKLCE